MIGQTISHYKILEKLGEGGMGVVYKAEDRRLKRTVALKFLREDAFGDEHQRSRFVREAQTTAALEHPNICTVYEIDEQHEQIFISMAFIEGHGLKERLRSGVMPMADVVRVVREVLRGLDVAHRKNIFHCDINLTNIMVTEDDHIKIMDFGLAQIVGATDLARTGMVHGTMYYMAPEQIRGDAVDGRTDIWSLGVCMYEMLTAGLPFKGDYEPAVFYSILNEEPRPISALRPELPVEICRIVHRALAKDPAQRYASAAELLAELDAVTVESGHSVPDTSASSRAAIAVLPFTNMSTDKDQEYFCDGIAEDIINGLAHVDELRVVARTSAFAFKNRSEDIREIGRKLDVDVVLEGSVRKWGDTLRITAQLVNVGDGYHIWSERYDRQMKDVFAIQDEISQAIVDMLKIKLVGDVEQALTRHYTTNFEAYTFYLKGRYYWNRRSEDALRKSLDCFQQAIAEDPDYALAHAGLADTFNLMGFYSAQSPHEVFPEAKKAAAKALEMDDSLAEAYASLGFSHMFYDWDWAEAERCFLRSLELNPNYPTALHWYSEYLVLVGRMEEAMAQSKKALESDPLSLIINTLLGWIPHFDRRFDEAVIQYHKTQEMDPNFVPAHFFLGLTYVQKSEYELAVQEFNRGAALFGSSEMFAAADGYARARWGKRDEARRIADSLKKKSAERCVPLYYVAAIHAGLGEKAEAFEWLRKAHEQHDIWLGFLGVDPIWDSLRDQPEIADMMVRVGLQGKMSENG
jgi:serine/threonine protein kinase/Tfp pilus assembly protein PilF